MYRLLLTALIAMAVFDGCSSHEDMPAAKVTQEPMYVDENTLILFALDAQSRHEFGKAVGYYDLLYSKTEDPLYRKESLKALVQGRYFKDVVKRLQAREAKGETLSEMERYYLVVSLIEIKAFESAEKEAKSLTVDFPVEKSYLLLAEVYIKQKDYISALAALESGYKINYSEQVLDQIAVVLYNYMKSPYEAISRIEQHIKTFGYSLMLTKRLVAFYGDQRDEAGLLATYPHLYDLEPTKANGDVVVQLYWNAKKMIELVGFLEKSGVNDELLLKLYTEDKNFKKAIPLAQKLYEESGDLDYLGQKAIFEYESASGRVEGKLLDSIINDLSQVVKVKEEGYYLNYLGYCLIDHDRDIDKGIEYVKRALKVEPDSGYFIDSLAWGYYKQGRCEEAMTLMQRVVEQLGKDDPEVKAHLKAINSCLKKEKTK